MRISKLFPVVCAVAFSVSFITARADDNSARAAAGAASEQKTNQPAQAVTLPVAAPEPIVTPAAVPETNTAPIAPPPPVENPPVAPTPAPPAEAQPPAIETNAPAGVVAPTPSENPPAAPETSVVPVQTSEPAMCENQPALTKSEKKAKAKADKRKAAAELKAKKEADKAAQEVKSSQTVKAPNPVKEPEFQPIVAPPMPISADKQAQFNALLEKYKANTITAGQYQAERAKILAEP